MKKPVPVMTRLPQELHAIAARLAVQEHRSMNAQIITLLYEALAARGAASPGQPTPAGASAGPMDSADTSPRRE